MIRGVGPTRGPVGLRGPFRYVAQVFGWAAAEAIACTIVLAGCSPAASTRSPDQPLAASSAPDCPTVVAAASASTQIAPPPPLSEQRKSDASAPGLVGTPTLHLWIGEHWVDVLESGVAGDVSIDGKVIMHRDLRSDGAPWADLVRYFGPIPPFEGVVLFPGVDPGTPVAATDSPFSAFVKTGPGNVRTCRTAGDLRRSSRGRQRPSHFASRRIRPIARRNESG